MIISQEVTITVKTDKPRVPRAVIGKAQQWQAQTLAAFQTQPGSPKHPLRWTPAKNQNRPPNTRWGYYSKQKAAYFATNGFGRGIPSRRTGKLVKQWIVDLDIDQITRQQAFFIALLNFLANVGVGNAPTTPAPDVVIRIANPSPIEQYVTGVNQQGFHKDTGWYQSGVVMDTALQQIEGILTT